MFGATEEEEIVPPITHVSVTLDGIPEVVEVHQAPDPYAESPETPEFEQPKKKKGKMLLENSSVEQESSGVARSLPCGRLEPFWVSGQNNWVSSARNAGEVFSSCVVWAQVLRLRML